MLASWCKRGISFILSQDFACTELQQNTLVHNVVRRFTTVDVFYFISSNLAYANGLTTRVCSNARKSAVNIMSGEETASIERRYLRKFVETSSMRGISRVVKTDSLVVRVMCTNEQQQTNMCRCSS